MEINQSYAYLQGRKEYRYRPISLTCAASKVIDRVVEQNFNNYLESNNLLDNSQHRAHHGRSTITNLLSCESSLAEYMNAGNPCDVV